MSIVQFYDGPSPTSFNSTSQSYIEMGSHVLTSLNQSESYQVDLACIIEDNTSETSVYGIVGLASSTTPSGVFGKFDVGGIEGNAYIDGDGNAKNVYGVGAYAVKEGSGTVENMFLFFGLGGGVEGGTVSKNYGLFLPDIAGGVGNWAIHTGAGLVRFGDHIGINGDATATSPLNITGLPTSAAGLASGDVWCDPTGGLNILKIV